MKTLNITITGAAGQIAYALLPLLARGDCFGADVRVNLHLVDLDLSEVEHNPFNRLRGTAQELEDVRLSFAALGDIEVTPHLEEAVSDADWILLLGGQPRKAGMDRSDLLKVNGESFRAQGAILNQYAKKTARILVVANPCNTNALLALMAAPTLSADQFFSLSELDVQRAYARLAQKANVDISAIENLFVWGNHSNTMVVDYLNATINGRPVTEFVDLDWLQSDFQESVRSAGAEIIKQRSASSALSAAQAIVRALQHLSGVVAAPFSIGRFTGMDEKTHYDIPEGVMFSLPTQDASQTILDLKSDDWMREAIQHSAEELLQEKSLVVEF